MFTVSCRMGASFGRQGEINGGRFPQTASLPFVVEKSLTGIANVRLSTTLANQCFPDALYTALPWTVLACYAYLLQLFEVTVLALLTRSLEVYHVDCWGFD